MVVDPRQLCDLAVALRTPAPHHPRGRHVCGAGPDSAGRGGRPSRGAAPDLSAELAGVGERDDRFPLPHGRGDEFHHGSPGIDPRSLPPKGLKARDIYIPDLHIGTIKVKARDFR